MLSDRRPEVPLSSAPSIVPGQILLQKYRVEELLGHGGMGVVFAARHLVLDERVAIKVLAPAATEDQEALVRLQREARILARVRNEHVVRVIDAGQLEDGAPFIVMEHLTGRDLGSLLEEQGQLGVRVAVGYVLQALVALAAAHANGVVHRDLKPENLFCTLGPDGTSVIKVLDFGISRLERSGHANASASMTGPSAVMGTPLYMSPEQLRDVHAVDARSDIWSIGVVLYELVTGLSPFSGASLGDIAVKIATEPPPPLVLSEPSLAPALDLVLAKCLCKSREERFANVAELARELEPLGPEGCRRLVERVERLAVEPPIHFAPGSPGFYAAGAPEPHRAAADALPPPPAVARRPRRAPWLLAVATPFALLVAWRLWQPQAANVAVTSPPARLVEQRPLRMPAESGPQIRVSVPEAKPPLLVDERRMPPASTSVSPKRGASTTPSAPVSKDPCDPPYTVDPQGRKKFRHECFTERAVR